MFDGWMVRSRKRFATGRSAERRVCRPEWAALVIVACLVPFSATRAQAAEARPWGTVRSVTEGNLLTIDSPDRGQIQIRLYAVDLPQLPRTTSVGVALEGQPFAHEAAAYVRDLLLGRQVQIDTHGKDRTGRWLSVVWLGEINVNLTLVKEGLAWVDPALKAPHLRVALEVAERQARVGKYGLWALPDPEPPWEYRKRHRLALQ
jgi:endonuclease YncB( thermonuclease family)